eukprot:scaffold59296_cov79-Phaeocystis_antarctica.AAC.1
MKKAKLISPWALACQHRQHLGHAAELKADIIPVVPLHVGPYWKLHSKAAAVDDEDKVRLVDCWGSLSHHAFLDEEAQARDTNTVQASGCDCGRRQIHVCCCRTAASNVVCACSRTRAAAYRLAAQPTSRLCPMSDVQ